MSNTESYRTAQKLEVTNKEQHARLVRHNVVTCDRVLAYKPRFEVKRLLLHMQEEKNLETKLD